jgi:hypothetical protein
MKIEDVSVASQTRVLVSPKEVTSLESELWFEFPPGYREFVTKLGQGVLSTLIRIYPPWQIAKELNDWRRRIDKYWFWDAGRKLLPKARALECVIIGDTVNGDELVFHPRRPRQLFVLPHESGRVFDAGGDLLSAVDWMCNSGKIGGRRRDRTFEPFDSRCEEESAGEKKKAIDPPGESLDDLSALAKRWATRHGVLKLARKDIELNNGQEAELQCLAIGCQGKAFWAQGCVAIFDVRDKSSDWELGSIYWHFDDGGYGAEYRWNESNLAKARKKKRK